MEQAKELHKLPETMFLWFHRWLLPHYEILKQQDKIKKGKKDGWDGYLDQYGNRYGLCTLIYEDGDKEEGTFMDDKRYGVRKCTAQHPQNICSHHHCRCKHRH